MWLPKDERRLLAGYYSLIGEVGTEEVYNIGKLAVCLRFHISDAPESDGADGASEPSDDSKAMIEEMPKYCDASNRIEKANRLLAERGLIKLTPHQHEPRDVLVGLTVDGYDLGRRYSNRFERSGLWFHEYRNHWIWLILAFFGGSVGAELIEWIGFLLK